MEGLIVVVVIGFVLFSVYKSGKSVGSRKGYHVGRCHQDISIVRSIHL